jgi:hypothetical protein
MRRVLIVVGGLLVLAGVGTASASFMITSVGQISPTVRAKLAGINTTVAERSKKKHVCADGSCSSAAVAYAYCPAGTSVTGGGFYEATGATFVSTTGGSAPVHTKRGFGWGVLLGDVGHTNGAFYAEVICGGHRTSGAADTPATSPASLSSLRAGLLNALHR